MDAVAGICPQHHGAVTFEWDASAERYFADCPHGPHRLLRGVGNPLTDASAGIHPSPLVGRIIGEPPKGVAAAGFPPRDHVFTQSERRGLKLAEIAQRRAARAAGEDVPYWENDPSDA